jgi:DNA-directed RNA polymerase specialized sigma24 family protein
MTAKPTNEADVLLRAFLDEADEVRCDHLLEEIVSRHARLVIERVIAWKLNVKPGRWDSVEWQEQEDIAEEVIVQLIRHLVNMRGVGSDSFGSFEDYVATAAHNACSNYLRRKYPERSRLRDRLRYILSHHEQLGIWRSDGREWLCGLASWKNQRHSRRSSDRLRQLSGDPDLISYALNSARRELELLCLVKSILEFVGAPVALDKLVDTVGDIFGTNAKTYGEPDDQSSGVAGEIWSDTEALLAERIDKGAYLSHVWKEICELSPEQRTALLLNLKDNEGSDITVIFVSSGVATISQMAEVLCLTLEEFLDIWKRLPLSDEDIANRLVISVRQVGSLRLSGRRRLSRRMELYERQRDLQIRRS